MTAITPDDFPPEMERDRFPCVYEPPMLPPWFWSRNGDDSCRRALHVRTGIAILTRRDQGFRLVSIHDGEDCPDIEASDLPQVVRNIEDLV